jgi:ABC-type transport system involved in multi-copper enzyme maturation permease subunit
MKQFKALITKEWKTHWASFLLPVWVSAGVYVLILAGWIISSIKGQGVLYQMQGETLEAGLENVILFGAGSVTTAMLGFISILTAISLSDSVINGGFKNHCEILHFSQPVSFAKIALSKYLFTVKGGILLLSLMSLFNTVLISLLAGILLHSRFYYGIMGWLQGWIMVSFSIVLLGSMFWFFAGLFKKKSFLLGILVILGIEAAIGVLNYSASWSIPSLLDYLLKLISLDISFNPDLPHGGIPDLELVIKQGWESILSWQSVLKLVYGAAFFIAGSLLYKRRELV